MKRRVKTVYQAIAATIGISLLWLGAPAKAYPELQYEHLQLNTSLERCASYAQTVLERKGFRTLPPQFSSATGYLPGIKAVIDCTLSIPNSPKRLLLWQARAIAPPKKFSAPSTSSTKP
uniref:Uncharacterized protein n=1 Tax=Desertifilum tharense IPPAS B-1220 TaxID=1781255 RepID=A0ACD5GPF9_9CYAN